MSAGLPSGDWWVAGPAVAEAEDADVELDEEVERFCTGRGLWPGLGGLADRRDHDGAGCADQGAVLTARRAAAGAAVAGAAASARASDVITAAAAAARVARVICACLMGFPLARFLRSLMRPQDMGHSFTADCRRRNTPARLESP